MDSQKFVFFPGDGGKRIAVNPREVKFVVEHKDFVQICFSKTETLNIRIAMHDAVAILNGTTPETAPAQGEVKAFLSRR